MIIILNWLVLNKPLNEYTHNYVCFWQLTYSTTRYGLYEVVSAELRKGNGNNFFSSLGKRYWEKIFNFQ